ncbi:hypothetical protein MTO96_031139, partial [Rhipicephalus appendiculatus]
QTPVSPTPPVAHLAENATQEQSPGVYTRSRACHARKNKLGSYPPAVGMTTDRASLDKRSGEDIRAYATGALRIAGANILRKRGEGRFEGTGNAIP